MLKLTALQALLERLRFEIGLLSSQQPSDDVEIDNDLLEIIEDQNAPIYGDQLLDDYNDYDDY